MFSKLPTEIIRKIICMSEDIDIRRHFGIYEKVKIPDGFIEKFNNIPMPFIHYDNNYTLILGANEMNYNIINENEFFIIPGVYTITKLNYYWHLRTDAHVSTTVVHRDRDCTPKCTYTNFLRTNKMSNHVFSIGFDYYQ